MKKQITRISVLQTSKVVAGLYLVMGLFYCLIGITGIFAESKGTKVHVSALLLMPVILSIMGFLFSLIACVSYNLIVKWLGGIEFEVTDSES